MDILMNDNYEYMYNVEVMNQAYEESYIASQMQNAIFNEGAGKTAWTSFTSFLTYVKERIMAFFEYMKKLLKKIKNKFTTKYIISKALKMNLDDKDVIVYDLKDINHTMKEVQDDLGTYALQILKQVETMYNNSISLNVYFSPKGLHDIGMLGNADYLATKGNTTFIVNISKMLSKYGVHDFNELKEGIINYVDKQKSTVKCTKDVIKEISKYDEELSKIINSCEKDIDKAEKSLSQLKRAEKISVTALDGQLEDKQFAAVKKFFNELLKHLEEYRKWMTSLLSAVTSVRTLNIKSLSSLVKNNNSDDKKDDDK